ncbi:ligase-associated DNA damage response exonuclease [Aquabacterium sp.]|uniref:ligase-associated DNA damage response exonuclease n=1 Tax=Aquabacterium sp. TaxID=1872578 RepID=UPI002486D018|nr:ligase-associated DNA damage response exonuclease [Aquabacterium sp.]MDI1260430.1 ligase-associated DNA damage response exonuclease [Aquabacterium sp.]
MADSNKDLVVARPQGLYCPPGDFYIDPWKPVSHALITHAHGDHARVGHEHYLAPEEGRRVLQARLGADMPLQTLPYGQAITHRGVRVSFHPAGHVLGSAQVRLEHEGRVWVASGDYKTGPDATCAPFEPVRCDVFITESTFGLPVFRWQAQQQVFDDINAWWRANAQVGRPSVLYAYSFGKAQRVLAGIDPSIGPIVAHGAMTLMNEAYRASGVPLPATQSVLDTSPADLKKSLVLAPPSAQGSGWTKRFGEHSDAFASGWMQLRGTRRRRGLDRGFVLSDHADWPGLLEAVQATQAPRVIVTHGYVEPLVRYFGEQGLQAGAFKTEYGDEAEEGEEAVPVAETPP